MRFVRYIRYSAVGTFFMGVLGVIQGCDAREGALFAFLIAVMNFCTGPVGVVEDQPVPPIFPKIYWTEAGTKIRRANLDGSNVEDLIAAAVLGRPIGITVDTANSQMYIVDEMGTPSDKIVRANLDGTGLTDLVTAGLTGPQYIGLDLSGGKMYWSEANFDRIQRANLDGSGLEDLVCGAVVPGCNNDNTGIANPVGFGLDTTQGKMYWAEGGLRRIQRANLDGSGLEDLVCDGVVPGCTTNSAGLSAGLFGLAVDAVNGKVYWIDFVTDKVQRANLDGSNVEDLICGAVVAGCNTDNVGISSPLDIVVDAGAGKLYFSDSDLTKIMRANLDGTNLEDVVTGVSAFGLALGN